MTETGTIDQASSPRARRSAKEKEYEREHVIPRQPAGIQAKFPYQYEHGATAAWTIVKPESVRGSAANSAVAVGLLGTGGRGSRVAGHCSSPCVAVRALVTLSHNIIKPFRYQLLLSCFAS